MPEGRANRRFVPRWVRTILLALCATHAFAQKTESFTPLTEQGTGVSRTVMASRLGYAFSDPPILLRQRLLGLAHGLRLLGRACLFDPEHSLQTEHAYAEWYARQGASIDAMSLDLDRWYFAGAPPESDPAQRLREVIRLIGLRAELRAMDPDEQHAACATYPEAIAAPRYDFVQILALDEAQRAGKAAPSEPPPARAAEPASPGEAVREIDPVTNPSLPPVNHE